MNGKLKVRKFPFVFAIWHCQSLFIHINAVHLRSVIQNNIKKNKKKWAKWKFDGLMLSNSYNMKYELHSYSLAARINCIQNKVLKINAEWIYNRVQPVIIRGTLLLLPYWLYWVDEWMFLHWNTVSNIIHSSVRTMTVMK